MSGQQSPTNGPKASKADDAMAIVDHIMTTYKPHEAPCVLMWRETINDFRSKNWPDFPAWTRDNEDTHRHWKTLGPRVVAELKRRKLTVIKVSKTIRLLVKHGGPPDRGGRRTDAAYRECLPNRDAPIRGIVVFPREAQQDHPLIVASLDRRGRASATGLENAIVAIETANDYSVLSNGSRDEILGRMDGVIRRAIEEKHPLFPRKVLDHG